jgi:hypothetical protein
MLEILETLLVPDWDTTTMQHIVSGWQQAVQAQLAAELNLALNNVKVVKVFQDRYKTLAEKPTEETVHRQFLLLRERLVKTAAHRETWLTCLAIVRSWRNEVETIEQSEERIQGDRFSPKVA